MADKIQIEIKPANNVYGFKVINIKGQTTAGRFHEQIQKLKSLCSSSNF